MFFLFQGSIFGFFVGFQGSSHSKLLHQAMCASPSLPSWRRSPDRVLHTKAQFHGDVGVRCTIPFASYDLSETKMSKMSRAKVPATRGISTYYPNISWEDPASNIRNDGWRHGVGIQTIQSRFLPLEIHHFESQQYLRVCPLGCLP